MPIPFVSIPIHIEHFNYPTPPDSSHPTSFRMSRLGFFILAGTLNPHEFQFRGSCPPASECSRPRARSFLSVASRSLMPCKGARRATAQELHGAPLIRHEGRGLVKLRDRWRLAFLDGGLRLATASLLRSNPGDFIPFLSFL